MLSDTTVRKLIASNDIWIHPMPADEAFQPASIDLRLASSFIWHRPFREPERVVIPEGAAIIELDPGDCVLACTIEAVTIPPNLVARVEGKSTWGRRFLMVHSTAGFIDPGFTGQITLELKNLSPNPLEIPFGAYIAQISFGYLDQECSRPYGQAGLNSHYQNQYGATEPRAD